MTRNGKRLARCVAGLSILALAGVLLVHVVAACADRRAEAAWAEAGFADHVLVERFPVRDANASALRVETAAAALGVELAPWGTERARERAAEGMAERARARLRTTLPPMPDGISGELRRLFGGEPSTGLLEPGVDARAQLTDDLVAALLEGDAPRWESDWTPDAEGRSHLNLGFMKLDTLLIARAVVEAGRGNADAARDALTAAERLSAGRARADALIALVHADGARQRIAAMRLLPRAEPAWIASFAPDDDDLFHAEAAIQANWRHRLRDSREFATMFAGDRMVPRRYAWRARIVRPLLSIDASRVSMRQAALVVALRDSDPCSGDADALARALEPVSPWPDRLLPPRGCGFPVGEAPTLGEWWLRASALPRLELALTRRVHELRAQATPRASGVVSGPEAGLPCAAWALRHETLEDGRLHVVLDAALPWPAALQDRVTREWTDPAGITR